MFDKIFSCIYKIRTKDIPSVSYYSVPLHLQPVFEKLGHKEGDSPVSEKMANLCLSLPISPYLTKANQMNVVEIIKDA